MDNKKTFQEKLDEIRAKHHENMTAMIEKSMQNKSQAERLRLWHENREAIEKVRVKAQKFLSENVVSFEK